MAVPSYATPLERTWHYAYLAICAAIFFFLIAPIIVIMPLSFNAEPYFTFTDKMRSFDPEGYSLRWYDSLLTFGMQAPEAPRDMSWWADAWANAKWVKAAKNSIIIGVCATIVATTLGTLAALGLSRPEMPFRRTIMAILISPMIVPLVITAVGMYFFYSMIGFTPRQLSEIWSDHEPLRGCSHEAQLVDHYVRRSQAPGGRGAHRCRADLRGQIL